MKRIFCLMMLISLMSCGDRPVETSKIDPFYTSFGDWDVYRVPLLKPYEALKVSEKYGWSINLFGAGDTGIPGVIEATVIKSMLVVHCNHTILNGEWVKESWYIMIPGKNIEKGFNNRLKLLEYLHSIGYNSEPKLYKMNQIYEAFSDHQPPLWNKLQ